MNVPILTFQETWNEAKTQETFSLVLKDWLEQNKGLLLELVELAAGVDGKPLIRLCLVCRKCFPAGMVRDIPVFSEYHTGDSSTQPAGYQRWRTQTCAGCLKSKLATDKISIRTDVEEETLAWMEEGLTWMSTEESRQDWSEFGKLPRLLSPEVQELVKQIQAIYKE